MKSMLLAAVALGASAWGGAAWACGDCGEFEYVPSRGYIDYRGMSEAQQREADMRARQEAEAKAMEQARATFIARFSITPDPSPAAETGAEGQRTTP